ncbi:MAG: hypothetical protein IJ838_04560 [Paludibacteraceae bacterium]|nr:hypothetical protein [Paludibacteraceae bacterium]
MERLDKYWIGIVVGLILPAVVGYIYIDTYNLYYALSTFGLALGKTLSKLLIVSVFPDMAFIFVFYAADMWKVSKGLLIGAFPYLLASIAVVL